METKNAQEWLNETYPTKSQRKKVKKILIAGKEKTHFSLLQMFSDNSENNHFLAIKLEKELDLSDFVNLENLLVRDQKITELKVSNCPKLTYLSCANNELGSLNLNNLVNLGIINCSNNLLTELDLSSQNPKKVTSLRLDNNNFSHSDLSIFSRFTRVRDLYLGTNKKKRIDKNIYNRFFGSLEELKNFTNLVELDINATDIDSGLEYLPTENLSTFYCANQRERAGVEKIKRVLGLSDKLAGGERNRGQREKIARIKSFQDYFRAAKKFHQWAHFLNSTVTRISHKTDLFDLQMLFFQQERLLLWRERAIPQESLELADTELKLAKWKVSKGFEKLTHQEVERVCQIRTQFVRARNLMLSSRNDWRIRCQPAQPIQSLIQVNPHLSLIRRSN